ncbi:Uma2 family endonuclease [[Phormidium] sp. ETS-05]|uniref:Uma2 family endonuclease n=1 Tax=[Phormidium] sp. ETS-05 TaxID=222819 RepID=UPI0018EF05E0|nr:Uma2 family endonuclease [[Phormidium] sp. ETS-05]
MTTKIINQTPILTDQLFLFPGYYSWQQFQTLEAAIAQMPGLRISYIDGWVEIMTLSERHELLKTIIGFLLELYFCEKDIECIPAGSATRQDENQAVSFEPDESYYIGSAKEHPDLAVEVAITSGGIDKLAKYERLQIPEVWFWENNQLAVYHWSGEGYEQVSRSGLLPDLDLELFQRCVAMPSLTAAKKEFVKAIRG